MKRQCNLTCVIREFNREDLEFFPNDFTPFPCPEPSFKLSRSPGTTCSPHQNPWEGKKTIQGESQTKPEPLARLNEKGIRKRQDLK